jgi:D-aminopeptidase
VPPSSQPPSPRPRARDLGVRIGLLTPGPTNSIVDVANVAVGHRTIWRDEPDRPAGRGIARTGVTAIVPFRAEDLFELRVPAGGAVLNGAGEAIGITTIREWGVIESPILLTTSMAIGRAYDGAVAFLVERVPRAGIDDALMPVVLECDDGDLNDSRTIQVEESDVTAAIQGAAGSAAGTPGLGVVGAGTGMTLFELKGGIGSASRVACPVDRACEQPVDASPRYTVGVLALTNFGWLERLTIDGVRVGEALTAEGWPATGGARSDADAGPRRERGSCAVVVATDAPLLPHQLERVARRAGLGLARAGSTAGHGSGEIFVAFSTGLRIPRSPADALITTTYLHDDYLDQLFAATVEAVEEAVVDSLFVGDTVEGRAGTVVPGLPVERTLDLLRAAGRLA